jgi:hypothetical protein
MKVTKFIMLQGLLVVVLLVTIGINVMFILDTSRRLYEVNPTTGKESHLTYTHLRNFLNAPSASGSITVLIQI